MNPRFDSDSTFRLQYFCMTLLSFVLIQKKVTKKKSRLTKNFDNPPRRTLRELHVLNSVAEEKHFVPLRGMLLQTDERAAPSLSRCADARSVRFVCEIFLRSFHGSAACMLSSNRSFNLFMPIIILGTSRAMSPPRRRASKCILRPFQMIPSQKNRE
jgi:hypothetical protein